MIDSNVSLSCAHYQAGGGASSAAATAKYEAASVSPSLSPTGHLLVAACLGVIGTLGFACNLAVLAMFWRFRALRTPINLLLVSISLSDLLVSVLGTPFSFAASIRGRWLIGRAGCVWYGFVNACLGIVSLISLAVLSYERYCTMTVPNMADGRDFRPALAGICFSWFYSMAWTLPPLLGWSRYGPEGPGTTCSVDWRSQTANNVSYVVCLFAFCLLLPFAVIVFSYGKLLHAIRQVRSSSSVVTRRREQRVLVMVVTMVVCYLVCWLPYGVVALMATFGPGDPLSPEASIVPSLLAKSSTVVNPFIYIFMNKQFYRCFRAFFRCSAVEGRSTLKTFSRVTKTLRGVRPELGDHQVSAAAPTSAHATPTSASATPQSHRRSSEADHRPPAHANGSKPKATLVAHYRE
ncbi:teleost multiple tissue opsin b [Vanacampus margaritifer]